MKLIHAAAAMILLLSASCRKQDNDNKTALRFEDNFLPIYATALPGEQGIAVCGVDQNNQHCIRYIRPDGSSHTLTSEKYYPQSDEFGQAKLITTTSGTQFWITASPITESPGASNYFINVDMETAPGVFVSVDTISVYGNMLSDAVRTADGGLAVLTSFYIDTAKNELKTTPRIYRYNSAGQRIASVALDSAYIGSAFNARALAERADGHLLISGYLIDSVTRQVFNASPGLLELRPDLSYTGRKTRLSANNGYVLASLPGAIFFGSDGGPLILSQTIINDYDRLSAWRLSPTGAVVWSRLFTDIPPGLDFVLQSFYQEADGSIMIAGTATLHRGETVWSLCRMKPDGEVAYCKNFQTPYSSSAATSLLGVHIAPMNGRCHLYGYARNATGTFGLITMRINPATGEPE